MLKTLQFTQQSAPQQCRSQNVLLLSVKFSRLSPRETSKDFTYMLSKYYDLPHVLAQEENF